MSSEYTPDEEVVREFYVEGSYARGARPHEGADEFERFIARVKAEAWDEGAAKGSEVGMEAIILNPMHTNPYRKEDGQ